MGSDDGQLLLYDVLRETSSEFSVPCLSHSEVDGDRIAGWQTGHNSAITSMKTASTIESILTGGMDGTIRVMSVERGCLLRVLGGSTNELATHEVGHRKSVYNITWSADHRIIASCGAERDVLLWNPFITKPLTRLAGSRSPLVDIVFNDAESQLLSLSADSTVRIWDIRMWQCLHIFRNKEVDRLGALAFDSKRGRILTGSTRLHTKALTKRADNFSEGYFGHRQGTNAGLVYSQQFGIVISADERRVIVWNAATATIVTEWQIPEGVTSLSFDVSERRLITGTTSGDLLVWNYANATLIKMYRGGVRKATNGNQKPKVNEAQPIIVAAVDKPHRVDVVVSIQDQKRILLHEDNASHSQIQNSRSVDVREYLGAYSIFFVPPCTLLIGTGVSLGVLFMSQVCKPILLPMLSIRIKENEAGRWTTSNAESVGSKKLTFSYKHMKSDNDAKGGNVDSDVQSKTYFQEQERIGDGTTAMLKQDVDAATTAASNSERQSQAADVHKRLEFSQSTTDKKAILWYGILLGPLHAGLPSSMQKVNANFQKEWLTVDTYIESITVITRLQHTAVTCRGDGTISFWSYPSAQMTEEEFGELLRFQASYKRGNAVHVLCLDQSEDTLFTGDVCGYFSSYSLNNLVYQTDLLQSPELVEKSVGFRVFDVGITAIVHLPKTKTLLVGSAKCEITLLKGNEIHKNTAVIWLYGTPNPMMKNITTNTEPTHRLPVDSATATYCLDLYRKQSIVTAVGGGVDSVAGIKQLFSGGSCSSSEYNYHYNDTNYDTDNCFHWSKTATYYLFEDVNSLHFDKLIKEMLTSEEPMLVQNEGEKLFLSDVNLIDNADTAADEAPSMKLPLARLGSTATVNTPREHHLEKQPTSFRYIPTRPLTHLSSSDTRKGVDFNTRRPMACRQKSDCKMVRNNNSLNMSINKAAYQGSVLTGLVESLPTCVTQPPQEIIDLQRKLLGFDDKDGDLSKKTRQQVESCPNAKEATAMSAVRYSYPLQLQQPPQIKRYAVRRGGRYSNKEDYDFQSNNDTENTRMTFRKRIYKKPSIALTTINGPNWEFSDLVSDAIEEDYSSGSDDPEVHYWQCDDSVSAVRRPQAPKLALDKQSYSRTHGLIRLTQSPTPDANEIDVPTVEESTELSDGDETLFTSIRKETSLLLSEVGNTSAIGLSTHVSNRSTSSEEGSDDEKKISKTLPRQDNKPQDGFAAAAQERLWFKRAQQECPPTKRRNRKYDVGTIPIRALMNLQILKPAHVQDPRRYHHFKKHEIRAAESRDGEQMYRVQLPTWAFGKAQMIRSHQYQSSSSPS